MNLRDMSGLWLVSEIIANEVMAKGRTAWHVRCEEMCLTLLAVGEKKKKNKRRSLIVSQIQANGRRWASLPHRGGHSGGRLIRRR